MIKLGIVGVTGLVGNKIFEILKEENLAQDVELFLMASEKSSNKKVFYYGKIFDIFELNEKCLDFGLDYVIFSAGDAISKVWAKRFVEKGTVVIDNTNAFRKDEEIPLVVPEINSDKLSNETMLISNPNCSTIQLAVVVDVLMKMSKVKKIVVSTYQSVSGAGRKALNDFKFNTGEYFPVNIHENIIAEIGSVDEDGFCTEERKIMFELNKILDSKFEVVATAVRVPVLYTHGESVYVEFEDDFDVNELKKELQKVEHLRVDDLFYSKDAINSNKTFVCRIKQQNKKSVSFFIFADNLRRGAAFNAVGILKRLIKLKNQH